VGVVEGLDCGAARRKVAVMNKYHYPWWGHVKAIIQAYPGQMGGRYLSPVETMNYEAVKAAIEDTQRMENGKARMKVIQLVHLNRTHTVEGAALTVPCSERTAANWQRQFFEMVARNRDFLD